MNARLVLPNFGDREADEANSRGYLGSAYVQLEDGSRVPVVFYDIGRLGQDLASEAESGHPFISAPGLIVLTEVTLSNME